MQISEQKADCNLKELTFVTYNIWFETAVAFPTRYDGDTNN